MRASGGRRTWRSDLVPRERPAGAAVNTRTRGTAGTWDGVDDALAAVESCWQRMVLCLRDRELTQRVAAVDEEPGDGCCRLGDPLQSPFASLRVTTVERSDSDGEHDVVGPLHRPPRQSLRRQPDGRSDGRGELLGRDNRAATPAAPGGGIHARP